MSEIDPNRPDILAFMAHVSKTLNHPLPPAKDVFAFGDQTAPHLNDSLLELVLEGKKTGTACYPIPSSMHWGPGDYAVVVDSTSTPRAVIRTVSHVRARFCEVTEEFALSEGEGNYEEWRAGHIRFWKELQGSKEFGEDSVPRLCCVRGLSWCIQTQSKTKPRRRMSVERTRTPEYWTIVTSTVITGDKHIMKRQQIRKPRSGWQHYRIQIYPEEN